MLPTSPRFKSLPRNSSIGSPSLLHKTLPTNELVTPIQESSQVTADSTYNPFGEETDSSTIAPIPFDKIVAMSSETDFNPFPGSIILIVILQQNSVIVSLREWKISTYYPSVCTNRVYPTYIEIHTAL